jgi:hypothetical protein
LHAWPREEGTATKEEKVLTMMVEKEVVRQEFEVVGVGKRAGRSGHGGDGRMELQMKKKEGDSSSRLEKGGCGLVLGWTRRWKMMAGSPVEETEGVEDRRRLRWAEDAEVRVVRW